MIEAEQGCYCCYLDEIRDSYVRYGVAAWMPRNDSSDLTNECIKHP